jgi:hypothetical protein
MAPPAFLRQSPIGDLTVWAVLGYHGTGRFMPDLAPTVYNIHTGGILSLAPTSRQYFMTLIALLNIAAYHADKGDPQASSACMRRAIKFLFKLDDPGFIARKALGVVKRRARDQAQQQG